MKDFMLIFISEDYADLNLSPEEIQGRIQKWMSWDEKMGKQGIRKEGNALQSDFRRVTGPSRTVSDRTSTEVKEIIGGYYLINVPDFERAIEVAQDYPDYDLGGTVEIREIMHY